MQGFLGVLRMYLKHAAILLAVGTLLQFTAPRTASPDAPKRPRITGIDHVRLYASDVGKTAQFYAEFAGLPVTSGYGCRSVSHPCFPVNMHQQIELQAAPSPAPSNWLAEVAYATDDLEKMRGYLQAHNVEVSAITVDQNGAHHFELRDPEGNPLAFIQRPDPRLGFPFANDRVGTQLFHAGFVVKNVAAENRFYLDLLGFRLYWQGGFKDDGLDWYEIQVPDGDNWIEYMLNIPATADHKELGVQNHFSLGVKDIHAAAAQLHKIGLPKIDGPEIGRDGKWGMDVYDPDGTRVEFMEFTPAGTPCCHPYTAPHPTP